mmetsp:Transcript_29698/g.97121  ORF Transcript_29698/g.97121 Transcript_29698/m.97121 type:complete len:245 (+) Transcript_29698:1394-2128(+)
MPSAASSSGWYTPALHTPSPSTPPALMYALEEYRKRSRAANPASASHRCSSPSDAAAASCPISLFLNTHSFWPDSSIGVTSLSVPNAAFTNPFTNDEAAFCLADSTTVSSSRPRRSLPVSARWLLYTSSGDLGAITSSSCAKCRNHSLSLQLPASSFSVSESSASPGTRHANARCRPTISAICWRVTGSEVSANTCATRSFEPRRRAVRSASVWKPRFRYSRNATSSAVCKSSGSARKSAQRSR